MAPQLPPPPPYQMAGGDHVQIGIVWDEAVAANLPTGLRPAAGMTGGLSIYRTIQARVLRPYSSAYIWLDVEGFDTPEGFKGRWMLAGVYGPEPVAAKALSRHCGLPVRNGTSRFELSPSRRKAIGTLNGRDVVTGEIIVGNDEFAPAEALLNYITRAPLGDGLLLVEVPFAAEARAAQPVSVIFDAPAGDAFAGHRIARLDWALEVRNDAFSICFPRPVRV
jgi:hypothetical protein